MFNKVTTWLFIFGVIGFTAAEISILEEFERDFGWKVNFTWSKAGEAVDANWTTESISIWRNDQEFVIYKPKEDGAKFLKNLTSDNYAANVTCHSKMPDVGNCSIWLNITQNATDDVYKTQVQWSSTLRQGPNSSKETVEKNILVQASKAKIRETQKPGARQVLNCSSEGVPAPHLSWTLGKGKNIREIPADFNQTSWNATSKLWQSWSVYKPTTSKQILVLCTPRQLSRKGDAKESLNESFLVNFNSSGIRIDSSITFTTFFVVIAFIIHTRKS